MLLDLVLPASLVLTSACYLTTLLPHRVLPDYVSVPGSHLLPSYQNPCFFFVELCTSVTTFRGAWTRATREVLSSARPPTKVCKTSNLDRQEVDKVEGQMCTIYERYMEIAVESFVGRCLKIEPSVRN